MIFPKSLNWTTLLGLGEETLVEPQVPNMGLDMGAMVRENMRLFQLVGDGDEGDGVGQSHLRTGNKREELFLLDPQLGQWRLVSGALGERPSG